MRTTLGSCVSALRLLGTLHLAVRYIHIPASTAQHSTNGSVLMSLAYNNAAKENDGKAAQRKLYRKLLIVIGIFSFILVVLTAMGYGGGNIMVDSSRRHRRRKQPRDYFRGGGMLASKVISIQEDSEALDLILSASVHLVDITFSHGYPWDGSGGSSNNNNSGDSSYYSGVKGEFCKLNFEAHKSDPTKVPMFRDLVAASPDCDYNRFTVDLRDITRKAREYDRTFKEKGSNVPHAMEPTGFVFHESRCGSTLVANSLIGMDPIHHRVYSESAPPIKALKSCGEDYKLCNIERAATLFRDVVYMMGRTNDEQESRLFFKVQSAGTRNIGVFRKAFPSTPWIFVYREPVQVMMSHLDVRRMEAANCMRTRRKPLEIIKNFVQKKGHDIQKLRPEFYCAAHLATICEAAVSELKDSETGMPLNYRDILDSLVQRVLPLHFKVPLGDIESERIMEIATKYSKGRNNRNQSWKDDSEKKEQRATPEIRKASEEFLKSSYDALETYHQRI